MPRVLFQELNVKRQEWTEKHDQDTGGIMGLLPLVMGTAVKISSTDPKNKTILFKNRRCKLVGYSLHDDDLVRLEECASPAMKLEHQPKELFVHIEKATWVWSKELGPGVIGIPPDWNILMTSASHNHMLPHCSSKANRQDQIYCCALSGATCHC